MNECFYEKTESALRSLFSVAQAKNELHFAFAMIPEMRGMQDAGWNTALETIRAFDEYLEFLQAMEPSKIKYQVALGFYVHLSEASGFYEVPKNMLRIATGQGYVLCPFSELVQEHRLTGDKIAPNANKILKDLAGHAKALGLDDLSDVFRDAFDPDIRNGYAHGDYIVWDDGLRLPKRNGGHARRLSWKEFNNVFERGVNFFTIMRKVIDSFLSTYEEPKIIRARLNNEPEAAWTIHRDKDRSTFEIKRG
jgi:hypothetical protein